jgi:serine protease AprX
VAGGCCALVRQAWREARGRRRAPAGATLKALLVLGAAPVRTRDGTGLEDRTVAGFGRIDVGACLPGTAAGSRVVILADSLKQGAVVTGSTRTYKVTLPKGGRLRAVLCWYDAPGERLVNDLDLSLTSPPGQPPAAPIWGNHLPGQPTKPGGPDRVNTVEVIEVDALAAGTWSLNVTGANVPAGPQPFSLVAGGQEIS